MCIEADQKRILAAEENRHGSQIREKLFLLLAQHSGAGRVWSWVRHACALSGHVPPFPTAKFADQACAILTSRKFEACHSAVGPLALPAQLPPDVCARSDGRDCLCDAVANYARGLRQEGRAHRVAEPSFCGECPPVRCPGQPAGSAGMLPLLWARSEHCLCFTALGKEPRASPTPHPSHFLEGQGSGDWGPCLAEISEAAAT